MTDAGEFEELVEPRSYMNIREGTRMDSVDALARASRIAVFTMCPWPVEDFGVPVYRLHQGEVEPRLEVELPDGWSISSAKGSRTLGVSGSEQKPGWHRGGTSKDVGRGSSSRRRGFREKHLDIAGVRLRIAGSELTGRELRRLASRLKQVSGE